MNATDIRGMSIAERIKILETIWDSLLTSDPDMESPDWHQDVLAERCRRSDEPSADFVSLADLKAARR